MSQSTQFSAFNFENAAIRTLIINDEPWFLSVDICSALNISNSRDAISKLDEDEYQILNLKDTVGLTDGIGNQVQSVGIVNESGMYTLILRCRDAVKKGSVPHRFRKWVTSEVLPQIRKTGQYSQNSQPNLVLDIHLPRIKEMDTNFSQLLYYAKEARNVMWETDRMVTQLYEMLGIQLVGHTSLTTKIKLLKEMDFAVENSEEVMRKHRHSFRQY
ncbi:BRO-N domain-containing protein [Frederiksenia canicola]|uniref:BRO family protein n=1 Tax=Frederiksenia canicola TaxID=123824 RepID=A0AAE7C2N1_9PAST|nr:BRO family protein [Frederiksenia canicola]QIM65249.1 hypothetical protein A4G17_07265 [Frederiksenia canicola]RPE96323.1 BRO family protein [Frederiksenia canicola]